MKCILDNEKLQNIGKLINPTKNNENRHYMPVLLGNMNCRLRKSKINLLINILDSVDISSVILGKNVQILRNKTTNPVHWITKGGDLKKNYQIRVEIVLLKLDATKSMTWNLHVNELQGNYKYDK